MLSLPDIDNAREFTAKVRSITRFLRSSRPETILIFAALLSASTGAWLPVDQPKLLTDLVSKEVWQRGSAYASLALFLLAGVLVAWASLRLWKVLTPAAETPDAIRPSALKGPLAFGPHDADLLRRLGRETETATLLDWILDDRVGLIILMGESGAGKTSLLRAGLPALLAAQAPPIAYHYWEAVPERSTAGFLNAVRAGWTATAEAPVPQKITDLDKSDQSEVRRVIVLDQIEQLSPDNDDHQPIFRRLKHAAVTAKPPHRITYIVAFRRDYAPTWFEFQYGQLAGHVPPMMSLRLFNEKQSKEIMAIIAEAAKFTVDITLVDNLIAGMKNDEGRISPVDIGITLLALNERALGKPDRHLDKGDYQIAGGATGLLANYVSSRLDRYRPDERTIIVQAMLELADLSTDHRLARGLMPDELAAKVRLPAATMTRYLNDLVSPQVRLLESLAPSGACRLSHERLIPALRLLGGVVLAEAEQARRMFDRAYGDWVAGQRRRRLLLDGRRLSDAVKYRDQFHWAADRDDKETFLRQSLAKRAWQRTIAGAAAAFLAASYFGWEQFNVMQYKRDLAAWRLPAALIDTSQLNALSIENDRLTHLRWLRCGVREPTLRIHKIDDLEGLRGCRNLVSLTLDVRESTVSDLDALKDLRGLTDLTLNLGESGVSSLDALKDLRGLTALTLDLGLRRVISIDPLRDLESLTTLTLHAGGSSLDPLKDLRGLTTSLTLDLFVSRVSGLDELKGLKDVKGLTALTLRAYSQGVISLDALKDLKGLTALTLHFIDSSVSSLDPLRDLNGLTTLYLRGSSVSSLDALRDLTGLTALTLDLTESSVSSLDVLKDIKGLTDLTLYLRGSSVSSLDALRDLRGLTALTLDLRESSVSSLDALKDFKGATDLRIDLRGSSVSSLDALKGLKGLTALTIDLRDNSVGSLDALKDLKGLTALTLVLHDNSVRSVDALKNLKDLTSLRLLRSTFDTSPIDLSALESFDGLETSVIIDPLHYRLDALPKSLRRLDLSDLRLPYQQ